MEEYKDIFSSPISVPLHCQVKHSIDLAPNPPLPNGPIYHLSLMGNEETSGRSKSYYKKGTSNQVPHFMGT